MYQVSDLKQSIRGILTGLNLNNVTDLNGKFQRAAITLLSKADVAEMTNRAPIMLYDGVFDYVPDETMFGGALIDIRPQGVDRSPNLDYVYKKMIDEFDRNKNILPNGVMVTFEQRKGTRIMRLAQTVATPRAVLNSASDTDGWNLGGDAADLAEDRTIFYESPVSLRFNLTP